MLGQAIAGFVLGYALLHPISMLIFRWLGPHQLVRRIRRQAHQMQGAVGDLLDVARLQDRNRIHKQHVFCSDDGLGVPSEVLPALFQVFEAAPAEYGESTGLGLAFCKAAVEAHDGRIWCESLEENGATFYFAIPIDKEETDNNVC